MMFQLVKSRTGWVPATDQDKDKMKRVGLGEVVEVNTLDQSNAGYRRKFTNLVTVAFENLPERLEHQFPTVEDLTYELVKRAGYYSKYTDLRGNTQYRAKHIPFDTMKKAEFDTLYNRMINVITNFIIPGLDKCELMDELLEFM